MGRGAFRLRNAVRLTLVLLIMTVFVTGVYAVVVRGGGALFDRAGEPDVGLSILATTIVALGFEPLLRRAESWATRLAHRGRKPPAELLGEFLSRVDLAYRTDDVALQMARLLAEGTGAAYAQVWLILDGQLTLAQSWPPNAPADPTPPELTNPDSDAPGRRVVPVRHQQEVLGALVIQERVRQPLSPMEEKLFTGLAAQAGLVLQAVQLQSELALQLAEISKRGSELRASRERIVATQDEERRRLERDIHDGAQQHLVALALQLRLAHTLVTRHPERTDAVLADLQTTAAETVNSLHDLSRGVYPRLLAKSGLVPALKAAAQISPVPVSVKAVDSVDGVAADVAAAIYFCCLEALQNAVKHSRASHIDLELRREGEFLIASVRDDGIGFAGDFSPEGGGIANMRDRIEALAGALMIESSPATGSTVVARIPVSQDSVASTAHAAVSRSAPFNESSTASFEISREV